MSMGIGFQDFNRRPVAAMSWVDYRQRQWNGAEALAQTMHRFEPGNLN